MKLQFFPDPLITLKAILATLTVSCSAVEVTPAPISHIACYLQGAGESSSGNLHVMVYDEQTGNLESYCTRENIPRYLEIGSSTGAKKVVTIANVPGGFFKMDDINSLESLSSTYISLCNEDPLAPSMSGTASFNARGSSVVSVHLTPLMSRIRIRSLKVDFSGRSYSGKTLDNIRAYLLDINGRCPIMADGPVRATEILCQGKFSPLDSAKMHHPEIICADTAPGCTLYCYPCESVAGLCRSRLVIEGTIDGHTYYYPIDIGNDEGVPRGHDLQYDITITRKGSVDPGIALEDGTVLIYWNIMDWNEYEEENIAY